MQFISISRRLTERFPDDQFAAHIEAERERARALPGRHRALHLESKGCSGRGELAAACAVPRLLSQRRVIVHLVDGTYELFRHFYGLRRVNDGKDRPLGAVTGVLNTVLQMVDEGATHLGVATDHVIESFRNTLWSGYKTGAGIEPQLRAQFSLSRRGFARWALRSGR